ncbi:MAG TPA: serine hydrolase domain-containing protein [Gammaproteobacteria bacterium]
MNIARIWACAALLSLSCAAAADKAPASLTRLDGSHISLTEADAFARKTLTEAHVTGTQLAVVQDGRLAWSAAYGLRGRDPDLPMDTVTTTWGASITKAVFATYVMQLVEQGKFDLDKPVAAQLPQPLDHYPDYKDKASELVKDPRWAKVTPRMLLSHSSGLANFTFLEPDHKLHLHFAPGSDFKYSGDGINLVQFLVEQQQGRPLDQLMQDALFTPFGMSRTGLIYRPEFAADVADRFDVQGKFITNTRRAQPRGAGSMTTSAEDLARFDLALMDGKLLKDRTRAEMFRPVLMLHALHQFPMPADQGSGKEADAVGLAYGVGWGLLTRTPYGPAYFKEGHGDGAENFDICFPQRGTCMVLLTNSDNGELAFRPLLEKIIGDDVTPWEWECYTPDCIAASRQFQ